MTLNLIPGVLSSFFGLWRKKVTEMLISKVIFFPHGYFDSICLNVTWQNLVSSYLAAGVPYYCAIRNLGLVHRLIFFLNKTETRTGWWHSKLDSSSYWYACRFSQGARVRRPVSLIFKKNQNRFWLKERSNSCWHFKTSCQ